MTQTPDQPCPDGEREMIPALEGGGPPVAPLRRRKHRSHPVRRFLRELAPFKGHILILVICFQLNWPEKQA